MKRYIVTLKFKRGGEARLRSKGINPDQARWAVIGALFDTQRDLIAEIESVDAEETE